MPTSVHSEDAKIDGSQDAQRRRGDHYDVIIVGLGPVGAVCAHLLGARGISTLVIEKEAGPYDLPRAIHIDHEIMRIMQSVGLAEPLLPKLATAAGGVHFGADLAITRPLQRYVTSDRLGWSSDYFFYQPELDAVLREQLALRESVDVRLGCKVTAVRPHGGSVSVVIDDEVEVSASYVFGCDGARSIVRKSVGIELEDLGFDESWIVADATVDGPIRIPNVQGLPHDIDLQRLVFLIGDPARPTSVIPGPRSYRRWEFMLLPGEKPEEFCREDRVKGLLAPWLRDVSYRLIRCVVYRFHALLATKWKSDRVLLLGDAAHQTPPFFGQGLCHGIRDAANLSWKLRMVLDGAASPSLLSSYPLERLPQVRSVVETSIRMGRFMCTLDREVARNRDAVMREQMQGAAASQIDIIPRLADGIIASNHAQNNAVGERFIQPPMVDHRGQRRLLDDFTSRGFVLLAATDLSIEGVEPPSSLRDQVKLDCFTVLSQDSMLPELAGELLDCSGELLRWFEERGCRGVLIRPDSYVYGVFSSSEEAIALVAYLERQLLNVSSPSKAQ
ncbi:bifunctional 3-(3-hydroxy-phenyl)propionate/3-hydroxycinnamic acid hydroxylase [Bradyrhizobium jicamae]|uniref:bifunctional 3-(3-hydroxy-phenyl)propionate/3-hydroxycinnamic acid hydroxylase MhpA n=1 Tax=Bradyrhizobium jicamae TaxID=280332 RepID=UPI001BAD89F6|nr:bifunctional 3-(3-hydroxy-phenyl)propionate/3-hydroxycinnamic acid hydroxylase [Bradyrhizobium jicamae]MBR0755328.1 bifunctional 3-(3-hydroxy-phenyl)propionate/3-hydroxycinnamic acid hydroxylase [Bradyrhizobium jicamae]